MTNSSTSDPLLAASASPDGPNGKTRRPRRKPVVGAVHAINEAADKAKRAGLTFDEFVASAIWAAELNDLPMPTPAFTAAFIDSLLARNEWHVVEEKMAEEKGS